MSYVDFFFILQFLINVTFYQRYLVQLGGILLQYFMMQTAKLYFLVNVRPIGKHLLSIVY